MVLPYRLYGDGADSSQGQHFEITSVLPLLAESSSTLDTRVCLAIRNTVTTSDRARDLIHECVVWSAEAARARALRGNVSSP